MSLITAMNVKKTYTKRGKHKCPSKCLSCFTFIRSKKCDSKEIICKKCNGKFHGEKCFKNHLTINLILFVTQLKMFKM